MGASYNKKVDQKTVMTIKTIDESTLIFIFNHMIYQVPLILSFRLLTINIGVNTAQYGHPCYKLQKDWNQYYHQPT